MALLCSKPGKERSAFFVPLCGPHCAQMKIKNGTKTIDLLFHRFFVSYYICLYKNSWYPETLGAILCALPSQLLYILLT